MTDQPTSADTAGDDGSEADRGATSGMPRWVKISLIVVAGLVVLFVVLNLLGVGSGGHGPGLHGLGGAAPVAAHVSR